jgi:hypothetical protein
MVNALKSMLVNRARAIATLFVNRPVRALTNVNANPASLQTVRVVRKSIRVPPIRVIKTVNALRLVPVHTHVNAMSVTSYTVPVRVLRLITVLPTRVIATHNAKRPVRVHTSVNVVQAIRVTVLAVEVDVERSINVSILRRRVTRMLTASRPVQALSDALVNVASVETVNSVRKPTRVTVTRVIRTPNAKRQDWVHTPVPAITDIPVMVRPVPNVIRAVNTPPRAMPMLSA